MEGAEEVLAFWFGTADDAGDETRRQRWFRKDPDFDAEISRRFGALHARAASGALDGWDAAPESCLALVIVLDQFSRNMFRGSPRAFACDAKALALARRALARRFDRSVPPVHAAFFYLPFEHSEDLADQRRAVDLFRRCAPHDGQERSIAYALRHLAIIERFGRFPHRNAVLGRQSTPEEAAFLRRPDSGF